jgi:hypothetical protein
LGLPEGVEEDNRIVDPRSSDDREEALRREIAETAYFRWIDGGFNHGGDLEDWLEAEKVVRDRFRQDRRCCKESLPARLSPARRA